MKRICMCLLVVCLLAIGFAMDAPEAEAATEGDLTYTFAMGKATITACSTSARGHLDIPSTLGGYPVTSIGNYAFEGCAGLTNVIIPNSVTSIGKSAFSGCTGLTSVIIGNGVTSIGESAFSGCTDLISVTIPDSVTSIGKEAFSGCTGLKEVHITDLEAWCDIRFLYPVLTNPLWYAGNLYLNGELVTNLVIPSSMTKIATDALSGCTSITSVTIPDSVTYICSGAFAGCTGLTSVTIPDSVTSISESAFARCTGLTSVTIPDSVTSISESAFAGCTGLTSVTIPDSVTSIGERAFSGCTGLTSMTLFDSVTSVGKDAFSGAPIEEVIFAEGTIKISASITRGMATLKRVTIPNSVTSIEKYAFSGCTGLKEVHITDLAAWCGIQFENYNANPLGYAGNLYLNGQLVTNLVIPDGVTSIRYSAFCGCTGLTSVTIPNSVTSIGDCAFYGCTGLTSVTIPDSVTNIGSDAFHGCSKMSIISLGNGVTKIGRDAFDGCSNLKTVKIPSIMDWLEISFENAKANPLFYADNLVAGDARVDDLIIPDGVTNIKPYAFYNYGFGQYSSMRRAFVVYIPDSVTNIGKSAFHIGNTYGEEDYDSGDFYNVVDYAHLIYGGSSGDFYSVIIDTNNSPLMDKTPHYGGVAKTSSGDTVVYCQQHDKHINLRTGASVSCVYTGTCDDACDACGATRPGGGHKYTDWYANNDGHWKECTGCGEVIEFTGHNPGPAATATSGQHCTVCNYQLAPPLATQAPTVAPTQAPTAAPTVAPTQAPTAAPTHAPTQAPTVAPTQAPTVAPTQAPTQAPTKAPTTKRTLKPTTVPTVAPQVVPDYATVILVKDNFEAGESIDFICVGNGTKNTLWVCHPDGTSTKVENVETVHTLNFSDPGTYTALLYTTNNMGSFQSKVVRFVVTEPTVPPTTVPTQEPTTAPVETPTVPTTAAPAPQPQGGMDTSMLIAIVISVVFAMVAITVTVILVKKNKASDK